MSNTVTANPRWGATYLTTAGPSDLDRGAGPGAAGERATTGSISRVRAGDPQASLGAEADEFPPGFAEFAEARARGLAAARAVSPAAAPFAPAAVERIWVQDRDVWPDLTA